MLVLTRRPRETVLIGSDIKVTVLNVMGSHVQIGIAAPKETSVHREELYERLKREANNRQPDR